MTYKILNLYRDLPGAECGECGKSGCFAFAGAVFLEDLPLADCPHLTPVDMAAIEGRMAPAKDEEGPNEATRLASLGNQFRAADWRALATAAGGSYPEGKGGTSRLNVLGRSLRVSPEGVRGEDGEPGPRLQIAVLDHLMLQPTGEPAKDWSSYRDLPGTARWSKAYRACVHRLALAFSGQIATLDRAALALGAREEPGSSASRAYRIPALPRVELLLRFWDREEDPEGRTTVLDPAFGRFSSSEDFDARAEVLVDAMVLSRLGPESLFFLVEALVERLVEEGVAV